VLSNVPKMFLTTWRKIPAIHLKQTHFKTHNQWHRTTSPYVL